MSKVEFGRPINLVTAEALLKRYNDLSEAVERRPLGTDPGGRDEFIKNKKNAFIFSKKSMLDLIVTKEADYVLVALGAHTTNEGGGKIKEGEFTVMTIGYVKDDTWKGQGVKLKIISDLDPGYQYPPKQVVDDLNYVQVSELIQSEGKMNIMVPPPPNNIHDNAGVELMKELIML
ncbi:hypothetical protein POV27_09435 [Aureisphaera galaxeae]|uniref:hypothetical protein n=1 Tax=Aureisphaera galaxeae TaxID=1538023 RepID=UPI00235024D3|nr:hypothetical protein [Aureisphaera galaxeae]MDC8004272.1 hypothetical protein [Aureisphaera galaxeae]